MAAPLFIFGGNTGVSSPKELRRLRSIAEALAGKNQAPRNIGEGLNAIGEALLYRATEGKAERMEKEGLDSASKTMNPIYEALGGGGGTSPSGKVGAALFGQPGAAGEIASTDPAPDVSSNGSTFEPFMSTVKSAGLTNPNGLAAVAATGRAESGWSPANAGRTWADPSESGQAGTSGGVMSWRADRLANLQRYAASKGEQGNGSPQTQAEFFMQEDPQLIAALNNAKSPEEAQQLMNNAWKFAGYNRAGGEAGRRIGYASAYAPQFQGQGTEVASLDPSAGMQPAVAAIEQQAPGSGYVDPMVSAPNAVPQGTQPPVQSGPPQQQAGAALPPLPSREVGPAPQIAPVQQQAPQQMAQAGNGLGLPQLYQALQNPWLNESQQEIILGEIERIQQQNDPLRQMQLRKSQLELEAAEAGNWSRLDDGRLYNQRTGEIRNAPINPNASPTDLGLNPQYGVDAEGNPVLLQLGKDGQVVRSKMPDGVTLSKEPIKFDAGTHWVLLDPITRQPVDKIMKENFQEASDKAAGTEAGKTGVQDAAAAPQALADADYSISLIDEMLTHPGRATATGMSSILDPRNYLAGTDATDFNTRKRQLEGRAFLQAFNSLRGGGQITEVEGKKATEAITRLNAAQSDKAFVEALTELKGILEVGKDRLRQKVSGNRVPAPQAGPAASGTEPAAAPAAADPLGLR